MAESVSCESRKSCIESLDRYIRTNRAPRMFYSGCQDRSMYERVNDTCTVPATFSNFKVISTLCFTLNYLGTLKLPNFSFSQRLYPLIRVPSTTSPSSPDSLICVDE